jgi:N-acetylneuraminate synthase
VSVKIIAEIGVNHNGNPEIFKKLILAAKECGCDYVKGQKRCPRECLTPEQYDRPVSNWTGAHTYGQYKERLELSKESWAHLFAFCNDIGIKLTASVFDKTSADFIASFKPDFIKIGSAEVTKLDLLKHVGEKGLPVIMSTGMSTVDEIDAAVRVLKSCDVEITLMHTTSTYPCSLDDVNLNVLDWLKERYGLPVGLSAHYKNSNGGCEAVAIAKGAEYIERHFTLDRTMPGTDHSASLEPVHLKRLVKHIRGAERAMGTNVKTVLPCEVKVREKCRGK